MQPVPISDTLSQVRALLNDTEDQIFHDEVILPQLKIAYDDLRVAAQNYNIPITNATSGAITVPVGSTKIGAEGIAFPQDFVEPLSLMERPVGQNTNYIRMVRKDFLPQGLNQTAYLGMWSYQNQVINLIGSTNDVEVKMYYVADTMGSIINENSVLTYVNCRNYLQYRTAALCAMNIGENETRASDLNNMAETMVDFLLNQGIKSKQSVATRRHGFRRNGRSNGYW